MAKTDSPKVHVNLDSFERPDKPAPFSVVLGGRRYVLRDIQDADYREILDGYRQAQRGHPEVLIRRLVNDGDQEEFFANRLPAYKLGELFRLYNEHYGINPGEAFASPPS